MFLFGSLAQNDNCEQHNNNNAHARNNNNVSSDDDDAGNIDSLHNR